MADMFSSLQPRAPEAEHSTDVKSTDPLTPIYRAGLVPLGIFATMSLVSVTALLAFITQRMISWRKHYKQYVGYNQYVILIYNLLLADLQQSVAFSISFHWLKIDRILAPTGACFIQAWFLQIGDVASGFFVLAIAIHTWLGVVRGYKMPYKWFVTMIMSIWFFALFLSVLGPAMYKERYFGRASGWCWVSQEHQDDRLWLHYLWIFVVEFGTMTIYAHLFFHLRGRIRSVVANNNGKLSRATKFMVLYPTVYVILTLPLAVGRMVVMTGHEVPDVFYIVAGCLLTSCGWIDALLYALTRRVLVSGDLSTGNYNRTTTATNPNAARPGDYDLHTMNAKGPISTSRTITITGGGKRLSHIVDSRGTRSYAVRSQSEDMEYEEDSYTRTGSQDSIIKPMATGDAINIVTETSVQVETADDRELGASPLPQKWLDSNV